ncbi:MAG: ABC transporter ATP-binding protein [Planctomycetes bacterium]|nr:ABC transporter ATP-binding protein [Planctomycetota bacterium]
MGDAAAIRCEGISKRYRLGRGRSGYETLRDRLARAARGLLGGGGAPGAAGANEVWAVRDVTFAVQPGEVVGLIGRNGAGKSTLLKLLTRITEPTAGRAVIRGRVASLLEVGTGFHPELTGRENIFLNGAILGMPRRETAARFDEIVAFAEIEKFVDTPVKHYSSGMYVRLAFAVAAHLSPEVLLVDEVLAVGDAAFQKKCLARMEAVNRGGLTILFVSHQMNAIRRLCARCLWLDGGAVRLDAPAEEAIAAYERAHLAGDLRGAARPGAPAEGASFVSWEVIEPRGSGPHTLNGLGTVRLAVTVEVRRAIAHGVHGVTLYDADNRVIWGWAAYNLRIEPGAVEFQYALDSLPVRPGRYTLHVSLYDENRMLDQWTCVPDLLVTTPPMTHPRDEWSGVLNTPCSLSLAPARAAPGAGAPGGDL